MCLKKVKGTFFIFFETKIFFWRDSQFWYSTWFYFWRWIRLTSSLELFWSVKNHTHKTKYVLKITERKKGEAKQLIFFSMIACEGFAIVRCCDVMIQKKKSRHQLTLLVCGRCVVKRGKFKHFCWDLTIRKWKGGSFVNYYMLG